MVARIEAIGDFVEQQQFRPAGERARDEHQAAFAIRQREKPALGERADAQAPEQRGDTPLFGRRELAHRDVGALHAGAHHLARAEIPVVVLVAVLAFGADVGDFFARRRPACRRFRRASDSGAARAPVGFGHTAPETQFEQLGLAGAVAADQQPALPRLDAPVDVAQHRALAAIEIDAA